MKISDLHPETQQALEAATLRQLLKHLDIRKDVQNIELMNLAGFCRNCLSKWYVAAAEEQQLSIDYEEARAHIYGMPYSEWKEKHQTPASPEQQQAFTQKNS